MVAIGVGRTNNKQASSSNRFFKGGLKFAIAVARKVDFAQGRAVFFGNSLRQIMALCTGKYFNGSFQMLAYKGLQI